MNYLLAGITVLVISAGSYLLGERLGGYQTVQDSLAAVGMGTPAEPDTPAGEARQEHHAKAGAHHGHASADTKRQGGRKVLYYRNPMGQADTSPTPKKDQMGMDYIPVYEGEEEEAGPAAPGRIRISTEKVQKLGVRSEAAALRSLGRTVRAPGQVEPDDRRVTVISPRFDGYVSRLHVNTTGQAVEKGQALFDAYSPDLAAAQREYSIAIQGMEAMKSAGGEATAGMRHLADAAQARLRNWGASPDKATDHAAGAGRRRTVTLRSPVSGVVTEKKAVQGMRFASGDTLYQVTDLSSVWVVADIAEMEIGELKRGAKATITLSAYPGRTFQGKVSFISPVLKPETRTVPVRIELPNPQMLLKPAMFAQVEFEVGGPAQVLAVPDSAVIDSGRRKVVLIALGEGRFEPREVRTGARGIDHIEIVEGLKAGENVVVAANFLIDAESSLKAALGGFAGQASQAGQPDHTGHTGHTGHAGHAGHAGHKH